jgi:hypothetical protein
VELIKGQTRIPEIADGVFKKLKNKQTGLKNNVKLKNKFMTKLPDYVMNPSRIDGHHFDTRTHDVLLALYYYNFAVIGAIKDLNNKLPDLDKVKKELQDAQVALANEMEKIFGDLKPPEEKK